MHGNRFSKKQGRQDSSCPDWSVLHHVGRRGLFKHCERGDRIWNSLHRWKHPPGTSYQKLFLERADLPSDVTFISEDCFRNFPPMDTLIKILHNELTR